MPNTCTLGHVLNFAQFRKALGVKVHARPILNMRRCGTGYSASDFEPASYLLSTSAYILPAKHVDKMLFRALLYNAFGTFFVLQLEFSP
jgi:hypothetical protein